MATTMRTVTGSLPEVVAFIENSVMAQSSSASMEAAVDLKTHGGGVAVREYERYSWTGSNRVGMTVTLERLILKRMIPANLLLIF